MPLGDGTLSDNGIATTNVALADEVEALNSIYGSDTITLQESGGPSSVTGVLRLPGSEISLLISFPAEYPDAPPEILKTQSTGDSGRKGEGEVAVHILRDVLARVWTEGQVCLFDLAEEAGPLLQTQQHENEHSDVAPTQGVVEQSTTKSHRSAASSLPTHHHHHHQPPGPRDGHALPFEHGSGSGSGSEPSSTMNMPSNAAVASSLDTPTYPPPNWSLSEALTANRSTFVARACPVRSLDEAQASLSHLLASNKKVASATHNISAWRIQSTNAQTGAVITVQDSDDDGETAAGGRLLHLMQLMDVWNCMVVVTRWYGGVKLGPDRFRLINQVARESLVKGGFVKEHGGEDKESGKGKGGGKGKGKR
ncbi:Impact family protein [Fonsecaea pedrosoi]|nr:Impact family protein [Fonsecaea pedrosoi]